MAFTGTTNSNTKSGTALWALNDIVLIITGKNGFAFNGYGCYCGIGGYGEPLDEIDE